MWGGGTSQRELGEAEDCSRVAADSSSEAPFPLDTHWGRKPAGERGASAGEGGTSAAEGGTSAGEGET